MKPLPKTGHKTIKWRQSTQRHLLYISNVFIFPIYPAPGRDRSQSAVSGWEQRAMGYGSLRSFRDIILFIHVAHCQWENIFFILLYIALKIAILCVNSLLNLLLKGQGCIDDANIGTWFHTQIKIPTNFNTGRV